MVDNVMCISMYRHALAKAVVFCCQVRLVAGSAPGAAEARALAGAARRASARAGAWGAA